MKRFLKKKWHRIPVGIVAILMALILVAGSAFAAFQFLSFTTEITVAEPMVAEYNLWGKYGGDSAWHPLPDEDSLTIDGSAGDVFNLSLRFSNYASNPLTLDTVISGGAGHITCTGFPVGATIPGDPSPWVTFPVSIAIDGDAPPATYSVTFSFKRS